MNSHRIAALITVSAAGIVLMWGAAGVAAAETPSQATASAPAPVAFSQGAVDIDLTLTNNTDSPMTLTWAGLNGSLDHWDQRPSATLAAHASEQITGYSHNMGSELDMAMTYEKGTGDTAALDVQANTDPLQGNINTTTGTGVTQDNGRPATDLTTTASVDDPASSWDHSVATMSVGPVS